MSELNYITNFSDLKAAKPSTLRQGARDIALDGLSIKNKLLDSQALFEKPRIQFLYIHHLFDDEIESFELLLKELSRKHSFISYSEAVQKLLSGDIDKPYIVFSCDDGFKNNLKAAEMMNAYGARGCFFVNPYTIETGDFKEIEQFCADKLNSPPIECMNWTDVDALLSKGHEIGSHTMEHMKVAETSLQSFEEDLGKSHEILTARCGSVNHFAYPYGLYSHFTGEAMEAVFKAGFDSCASAERGCHISDGEPIKREELFIRRDHVICAWKLSHIMYFISNNVKNASLENNYSPYAK